MTSFQIVSDLHIEYKNDEVPNPLKFITPSADVLILAGDIGSFYKYHQLKSFLEQLCPYFKIVLYIPGNHEYYTMPGSIPRNMKHLHALLLTIELAIPNLHVLNRSSVRIGNVCILGCTLWSKAKIKIPPFICRISGMSTMLYNYLHDEDLSYIKKMMEYCSNKKYKLLVVTHHCPTFTVFKKKKKDKYISLYATALDNLLFKELVHTWVCGHIHQNFDLITPGGTHLVGNQVGKPKDKITDYKKDMVIIV